MYRSRDRFVSVEKGIELDSREPLPPYPNPCYDLLTIPIYEYYVYKVYIKVFNSEGKLAMEQEMQDSRKQITISTKKLPPGAYDYILNVGTRTYKGSFVVVR